MLRSPLRVAPTLLAIFACAILSTPPTAAQDAAPEPVAGLGDRLIAAGILPHADYVGVAAFNPVGGIKQGQQYGGVLELGTDFDLDRIAGIPRTALHIRFADITGQSISTKDVGNINLPDEVAGSFDTYRLSELSFDTALLDDRVELLAGRIGANADFAGVPAYCGFQTNPICAHLPIFGNVQLTSYPFQVWGGRLRYRPAPRYAISAGAYQVDPTISDRNHHGFDFTTKYSHGVTLPLEFAYGTMGADDAYPRDLKIGGFYDTANFQDPAYDRQGNPFLVTGQPPANHQGRGGIYAVFDQTVYHFGGDAARTAAVFGGVSTSLDKPEQYDWSGIIGIVARGAFAARLHDTIGFAVTNQKFSGREESPFSKKAARWPAAAARRSAN